jgi:hypothetical protein
LKKKILDYFQPTAVRRSRRLWESKGFWLADYFGCIGLLFLNLLLTDMNGNLPFLTFNASNIFRLLTCAIAILLNLVIVVFANKLRIAAAGAMVLYFIMGFYFWYAFNIRHGLALGFWFF